MEEIAFEGSFDPLGAFIFLGVIDKAIFYGRDVIEGVGGYQLREEAAPCMTLFRAEKDDIDPENANFWDVNTE